MDDNKIFLFADGATRNNQSKDNLGAWGAILVYKGNTKEFFGVVENTTNNVCELLAVISGLSKIKNKDIPVEVVSDSQYVISGMNSWVQNWETNGWKTANKKPVENKELWLWLLDLSCQFSNITFTKCKGHSDNPMNNKVDLLCNQAMDEYLRSKND